jgi:hypothetical protein
MTEHIVYPRKKLKSIGYFAAGIRLASTKANITTVLPNRPTVKNN